MGKVTKWHDLANEPIDEFGRKTLGGIAKTADTLALRKLLECAECAPDDCQSPDEPIDDLLNLARSLPVNEHLVLGRSLGDQDGPVEDIQRLIDKFFNTVAVLSSKMRSRQIYSRDREWDPQIEVVKGMTWQDVGRKLRKQMMSRLGQRCECDWCGRYQHTERGQREREWVNAAALAILGDPFDLVERMRSRRGLDRFDRRVLADLLESAFNGEVEISTASQWPSKKNRGPSLRVGGAQILRPLEGDRQALWHL